MPPISNNEASHLPISSDALTGHPIGQVPRDELRALVEQLTAEGFHTVASCSALGFAELKVLASAGLRLVATTISVKRC